MSKVLWRELTIKSDYITELYNDVDPQKFGQICLVHDLNYYDLLDETKIARQNGAYALILDLSKIPEKLKIAPDYDAHLVKMSVKLAEIRADNARIAAAIDELLKEI
jgi:hypothetical protein